MNKILEKIYSEKDFSQLLAIIYASLAGFYIRYYFFDWVLTVLFTICIFALFKIIIDYSISVGKIKFLFQKYSNSEIKVINWFVINGTSFSRNSIYEKNLERSAIDSLIARGDILYNQHLINGFYLNKKLYSKFLSYYKKSWEVFFKKNEYLKDSEINKQEVSSNV